MFTASTILSICLGVISQGDVTKPLDQEREWKTADGRFTTKATLVGFGPDGLQLKKTDGKIVSVTIGKLSDSDQMHARGVFATMPDRPILGMQMTELSKAKESFKATEEYKTDAELRSLVNAYPAQACLFIQQLVAGSPAESSELKRGYLVTHVNQRPVKDMDSLADAMMPLKSGDDCQIRFLRMEAKGKTIAWKPGTAIVKTISVASLTARLEERKKAEARRSPLQIIATGLSTNVIGVPILTLKVKNVRDSDSLAFTIEAECYNSFDEKVRSISGSHIFGGISQTRIRAGDEETSKWTLNLHENTTRVVARVVRVKMDDGTEWNAKDGEVQEVTVKMKE